MSSEFRRLWFTWNDDSDDNVDEVHGTFELVTDLRDAIASRLGPQCVPSAAAIAISLSSGEPLKMSDSVFDRISKKYSLNPQASGAELLVVSLKSLKQLSPGSSRPHSAIRNSGHHFSHSGIAESTGSSRSYNYSAAPDVVAAPHPLQRAAIVRQPPTPPPPIDAAAEDEGTVSSHHQLPNARPTLMTSPLHYNDPLESSSTASITSDVMRGAIREIRGGGAVTAGARRLVRPVSRPVRPEYAAVQQTHAVDPNQDPDELTLSDKAVSVLDADRQLRKAVAGYVRARDVSLSRSSGPPYQEAELSQEAGSDEDCPPSEAGTVPPNTVPANPRPTPPTSATAQRRSSTHAPVVLSRLSMDEAASTGRAGPSPAPPLKASTASRPASSSFRSGSGHQQLQHQYLAPRAPRVDLDDKEAEDEIAEDDTIVDEQESRRFEDLVAKGFTRARSGDVRDNDSAAQAQRYVRPKHQGIGGAAQRADADLGYHMPRSSSISRPTSAHPGRTTVAQHFAAVQSAAPTNAADPTLEDGGMYDQQARSVSPRRPIPSRPTSAMAGIQRDRSIANNREALKAATSAAAQPSSCKVDEVTLKVPQQPIGSSSGHHQHLLPFNTVHTSPYKNPDHQQRPASAVSPRKAPWGNSDPALQTNVDGINSATISGLRRPTSATSPPRQYQGSHAQQQSPLPHQQQQQQRPATALGGGNIRRVYQYKYRNEFSQQEHLVNAGWRTSHFDKGMLTAEVEEGVGEEMAILNSRGYKSPPRAESRIGRTIDVVVSPDPAVGAYFDECVVHPEQLQFPQTVPERDHTARARANLASTLSRDVSPSKGRRVSISQSSVDNSREGTPQRLTNNPNLSSRPTSAHFRVSSTPIRSARPPSAPGYGRLFGNVPAMAETNFPETSIATEGRNRSPSPRKQMAASESTPLPSSFDSGPATLEMTNEVTGRRESLTLRQYFSQLQQLMAEDEAAEALKRNKRASANGDSLPWNRPEEHQREASMAKPICPADVVQQKTLTPKPPPITMVNLQQQPATSGNREGGNASAPVPPAPEGRPQQPSALIPEGKQVRPPAVMATKTEEVFPVVATKPIKPTPPLTKLNLQLNPAENLLLKEEAKAREVIESEFANPASSRSFLERAEGAFRAQLVQNEGSPRQTLNNQQAIIAAEIAEFARKKAQQEAYELQQQRQRFDDYLATQRGFVLVEEEKHRHTIADVEDEERAEYVELKREDHVSVDRRLEATRVLALAAEAEATRLAEDETIAETAVETSSASISLMNESDAAASPQSPSMVSVSTAAPKSRVKSAAADNGVSVLAGSGAQQISSFGGSSTNDPLRSSEIHSGLRTPIKSIDGDGSGPSSPRNIPWSGGGGGSTNSITSGAIADRLGDVQHAEAYDRGIIARQEAEWYSERIEDQFFRGMELLTLCDEEANLRDELEIAEREQRTVFSEAFLIGKEKRVLQGNKTSDPDGGEGIQNDTSTEGKQTPSRRLTDFDGEDRPFDIHVSSVGNMAESSETVLYTPTAQPLSKSSNPMLLGGRPADSPAFGPIRVSVVNGDSSSSLGNLRSPKSESELFVNAALAAVEADEVDQRDAVDLLEYKARNTLVDKEIDAIEAAETQQAEREEEEAQQKTAVEARSKAEEDEKQKAIDEQRRKHEVALQECEAAEGSARSGLSEQSIAAQFTFLSSLLSPFKLEGLHISEAEARAVLAISEGADWDGILPELQAQELSAERFRTNVVRSMRRASMTRLSPSMQGGSPPLLPKGRSASILLNADVASSSPSSNETPTVAKKDDQGGFPDRYNGVDRDDSRQSSEQIERRRSSLFLGGGVGPIPAVTQSPPTTSPLVPITKNKVQSSGDGKVVSSSGGTTSRVKPLGGFSATDARSPEAVVRSSQDKLASSKRDNYNTAGILQAISHSLSLSGGRSGGVAGGESPTFVSRREALVASGAAMGANVVAVSSPIEGVVNPEASVRIGNKIFDTETEKMYVVIGEKQEAFALEDDVSTGSGSDDSVVSELQEGSNFGSEPPKAPTVVIADIRASASAPSKPTSPSPPTAAAATSPAVKPTLSISSLVGPEQPLTTKKADSEDDEDLSSSEIDLTDDENIPQSMSKKQTSPPKKIDHAHHNTNPVDAPAPTTSTATKQPIPAAAPQTTTAPAPVQPMPSATGTALTDIETGDEDDLDFDLDDDDTKSRKSVSIKLPPKNSTVAAAANATAQPPAPSRTKSNKSLGGRSVTDSEFVLEGDDDDDDELDFDLDD